MNEEYDEDFKVILTAVFLPNGYCHVEMDLNFEKINVNSRAIFSWITDIKMTEPSLRYKYPKYDAAVKATLT